MRANKRKSGKFEHSAKGAARRWGAKSVLALCLVAAFAVALTIGGTLAFLKQETGPVTNTFQAGNITYTLNLEPNADGVEMPEKLTAQETTALSVTFTPNKAPVKTGYTFGGWYYDSDCTQLHTAADASGITVTYGDEKDSDEAPNKVKITLYAKWTANTYEVAYNGNGATEVAMDNTVYTYDTTGKLAKNTFQRTGYAFQGWSKTATGTVEFEDEAEVLNLTAEDGGEVTLYAVWKQMDFELSFDTQTEKVANPEKKTVTFEKSYGELPVVTRTGYIFEGWALNEDGTNPIDKDSIVEIASNHTAYAQWTPITYTVKYDNNVDPKDTSVTQPTGSTADSTHTYDVSKVLTANGYSRTGYTFLGWNTKADGTGDSYDNNAAVVNLATTQNASVTLYAQWGVKSYVIHYIANGGSGTMADQSIKYDVPTVLSKNQFTKSDYSFMGWALSANGEVAYPDEQTVVNLMESGTLDLYAIWAQNPHTVYFNYNGGSGSVKSQPFLNGKAYGPLPEYPTKTEMLFTGWYTQASGGTRVKPETIANQTDDHTLYAHWESSPANDIVKNLTVKNNPDDNGDGVVDDIYLRFQCSSSFEKFNIPLNGLVVGQKYKITYTASNNASFGDYIKGYKNAVYGSYIVPDVNEYGGLIQEAVANDIIKTWDDRKEPDGNNDGSQVATNDAQLQGPFNRSITFTATKPLMYWTWDMGLMEDGPYYDYNIMNIVLEPVAPTIKFGSKIILGGNGAKFASQSNGTYTSTFTFDGESGCETVYYPITGLSKGLTYTIKFDHEFSGSLIHDTKTNSSPSYDYGCAITNTKPTKTGSYLKDLETWASGQFVKKTVDGKVDGVTLTFKATGDTAYWVWNMANCSDTKNTTTKVTVTQFSVKDSTNSVTFYTASSKAGSATTLALDVHDELDFDFNIDVDELGAFANDMPVAGKDFIMEFNPTEGYAMPESVLVWIDGVSHVYTLDDLYAGDDDQGNPIYMLWIPGDMLNAGGSLYIEALAVEVSVPGTEPTEPETEPTEPETEPTEPETQPTEPETQPTEPETQPTEPETQPTDPETQPTEPETEPTDPETEPTDPSEAATEPSVAATDPTETATLPPEETDPTEETEEVTE